MKIAMFDTRTYDRSSFEAANADFGHQLTFLEPRLTKDTAALATGHDAVCGFVNDRIDEPTLQTLHRVGVRIVALRSAGYNHVDLLAAGRPSRPVVRVPEYSPHAVAEHAVGLVLALNRKIHRAYARVREWNFSLDGLVGFDLHGKTVGIVGTGRIGAATAQIFRGFGCRLLAHDATQDPELVASLGLQYVELAALCREADIISLHVPLTPSTRYLIDAEAMAVMKPAALLINTGRGALIDSRALIVALKHGRIGGAGLDVYEEEEGVFFHDLSGQLLQDDVLARLLTFPNVIVTAHQAFLTREALDGIARVSLANLRAFEEGRLENVVRAEEVFRVV
jgi:D-lactate dehydrogenase